ncbi:MAG: DUF882 domain-containing protein [Cohaesibacter sp.]|nr:DUF882 domain-containing protein [Cohaesibacter sp.]
MARLNTAKDQLRHWWSAHAFLPSICKAATYAACVLVPMLWSHEAQAANRSLTLYNTHTKETTTIIYKRGGRFDADGLRKLNRFLRDWRRNEIIQMDPALFDLMWQVYKQTGARKPIHVVSGYRSPATNNMLRRRSRGVAKQSRHTRGQAMDFYLPGVPVSKIRAVALRMQAGGVGYYPRSNSPFVHIDTGNVRHWPRMTRKQLARVFPRGNTVHVPTDGKPFKGYKQAKIKVARLKSQMVRSSRSVGRFTQIAKAAPSPSTRTPSAAQVAKAQQGTQTGSFLGNLLKRTPQSRPTPPAAPAILAKAAPIELAPNSDPQSGQPTDQQQQAPFQLAALPRARAPQPRPTRPVAPAPINLAANEPESDALPAATELTQDNQDSQNNQEEQNLIQLAALPRPRSAPERSAPVDPAPLALTAEPQLVLAQGPDPLSTADLVPSDPISTAGTASTQEHLQLASIPQTSPEREEILSSFGTVPDQTNSAQTAPQAAIKQAAIQKDATPETAPQRAEDAIAQLADSSDQTEQTENRFAYAPRPAPLSNPAQTEQDQRLQLASLPNAKPSLDRQEADQLGLAPKPRTGLNTQKPRNQAAAKTDQLAKLTFSYGPASMAHFAHMKQSTQTITFARLSRPAPAHLHGLVAKPAQLIDQGFSRQPINIRGIRQFAGRAVTAVNIRKFN